MASEPTESNVSGSSWKPAQVYAMATVCLLIGLVIGYLFRGSEAPNSVTSTPSPEAAPSAGTPGPMGQQQMPTLEQMKHMADTKAEPLLQQLKSDSKNAALLVQIGDTYKSAHQFKDAAAYYEKALQIDPQNAGVRTDMASCLYYGGEVDPAIAQLEEVLKADPGNPGALFNLGMIKWKSKMDADGAIATWEKLLKLHPELQNKAGVEKLIAEARQHANLK